VENGLLGTPAATLGFQPYEEKNAEEVKRIEVEDGVHRLETLLEATVDKNFDKLEIYALRNILCLDTSLLPWVRLGHYKVRYRAGSRQIKCV
jgi:kinetochore protein Mis12/MTW1